MKQLTFVDSEDHLAVVQDLNVEIFRTWSGMLASFNALS
jgi:hypothetical protein